MSEKYPEPPIRNDRIGISATESQRENKVSSFRLTFSDILLVEDGILIDCVDNQLVFGELEETAIAFYYWVRGDRTSSKKVIAVTRQLAKNTVIMSLQDRRSHLSWHTATHNEVIISLK